jgi:ATP adenylyltransferase
MSLAVPRCRTRPLCSRRKEGIGVTRATRNNTRLCSFCATARGVPRADYDEPVLMSDHFFVVPSLGGFLEGWLLVVPREHLLNLRQTPRSCRAELEAVVAEVSRALESRYGPLVKFEHGPGQCGSSAGCSIDHAHLHVVPYRAPLREAVEAESRADLGLVQVDSLFEIVSTPPRSSYLYLEEADGQAFIGFADALESQLVRRVLARRAGRGTSFDWREDLALENLARTRAAIVAA